MASDMQSDLFRDERNVVQGPLFQELLKWGEKLLILYESDHAVCCILRALPVASRHLIFRLLYMPASRKQPLSFELIQAFFNTKQGYQLASGCLVELKILERVSTGSDVGFCLNFAFARNLRKVVSSDVDLPFPDGEDIPLEKNPSLQVLEDHSQKKWESILHFLVGVNSDQNNTPSTPIVQALRRTSLVERNSNELKITNQGFQFLLKDPYTQVWILLIDLISAQTKRSLSAMAEILLFLFKISFCVLGQGYPTSALTDTQFQTLDVLCELGLVYKKSKQASLFYPTKVGRRLVANTGSSGKADSKSVSASLGSCEIIAETNFRVYAYTQSRLQVDLISMFVHMRIRLPNLAVGQITNDSVRSALQNGITAEQIIGYLNAHCSPKCRDRRIPSNVSQMIRLWEAERDRLQAKDAVLLDGFADEAGFDKVDKYAFETGAKLWSSKNRRTIAVSADSADAVCKFVRTNGIQ
mmetsp:Transcript_11787/g.35952  ORF Transcript_11787/g.35952 Transcript_11787/m.35952 type:complete len:470 (+) Transcript_11787:146-1555(+)|eukprot:CAMPEP_0198736188 /NCGR_PEP_ID=MMETSP1475-20131203/64074_1 /TAXON_ID= ORGANISM="Unidentified sp., Strain CCMP1999" /NCGR_SAMPLE_ID=MMETSP1475 /ASSEMBLY_ACC=CAM_ASM_001111 /LENGTH=469 /DNA_ID=CAMNT_0044499957 /DNA_START=106 /DNA_END=1515 /DNA_ORIENTATION=-